MMLLLSLAPMMAQEHVASCPAQPTASHGLKLGPAQKKAIGAFLKAQPSGQFSVQKSGLQKMRTKRQSVPSPYRTSPSGAYIQGWLGGEYENYWYELQTDGVENELWTYDGYTPMTTGILRNGYLEGYYCLMSYGYAFVYRITMTLSGEVKLQEEVELKDYSDIVLTMAYDSEEDRIMAFTMNPTGDSYMIRMLDPESNEFTDINDSVAYNDVCVSLAWDPNDGNFYGITPNCNLVSIDATTGEMTKVMDLQVSVSSSFQGMTFSPKDNAFVWASVDVHGKSAVYLVDPVNKTCTKTGDLPDYEHYYFLVTSDEPIYGEAPARPTIDSFNFNEGATSGNVVVTLPTKTYDGGQLTGEVNLTAVIDSDTVTTVSGTAGSQITVQLDNLTEGEKEFRFIASTNGVYGPEAYRKYYVGYDTPIAPENVTLEEGKVSWSKPTRGVHNGYVDVDNETFNVYLAGEQINQEPISDTTLSFTMPDVEYSALVASVEADNHGHVSEKGYSNSINYGKPYELPFSMQPTKEQSPVFSITDANNDSVTWEYKDYYYKAFALYTMADYPADDWLMLPMMNLPKGEKAIELSFEHEAFTEYYNENLEVAYGETPNPEEMTVIDTLSFNNYDFSTHTTYFTVPSAGVYYIAFHGNSAGDCMGISIRNFNVKESEKSAAAPKAPSNLVAKAGDKGSLNATTTFTMPTQTISNDLISSGQTLTAYVSSSVDTVQVSGRPGENVSAQVTTVQGFNDIDVYTVCGGNEGLSTSTRLFTGNDVPLPPSPVLADMSEDNMTAHFHWSDSITGENGGYVDPQTVKFTVYMEDEYGQWAPSEELGNQTYYDYTVEDGTQLGTVSIGIVASNEQGSSSVFSIGSATIGEPYQLPMNEQFENTAGTYQPLVVEAPTDEFSIQWSICSTTYLANFIPEEDNLYNAILGMTYDENQTRARLMLPKFSTVGVANPVIEINSYNNENTAPIKVLAESYNTGLVEIGSFNESGQKGWINERIALPEQFRDRKWVAIHLEPQYENTDKFVAISTYRIRNLFNNDCGIVNAQISKFSNVGEDVNYNVYVQNLGAQDTKAPELVCEILKDQKVVSTLNPESQPDVNLAVFDSCLYSFSYSPTADMLGDIVVRVSINNTDDDVTNNIILDTINIAKGRAVVVNDLRAEALESGVKLTWTNPALNYGFEGFEGYAPFSYGDNLGEFKCVDADGQILDYFLYWSFPNQQIPKAWQVMNGPKVKEYEIASGLEPDESLLQPYEGEQCIAALKPFGVFENVEADDWLISPEIKSGSDVSFMISNIIQGSEKCLVMYSSTTDDLSSFEVIDTIENYNPEWKEYQYTLPDDARYFAIRYVGGDFGITLDNISYTPSAAQPELVGYDVYRNSTIIAENVEPSGIYTDVSGEDDASVYYNIVPVLKVGDELLRQVESNTAYVIPLGIDECELPAHPFNIYSVDGILVGTNATSLSGLPQGVYIVEGRKYVVK
jgi:hypothetical protein